METFKLMNEEISGEVEGIRYSIDKSIVDHMKKVHNVDAIKEIQEALRKAKEVERNKNAS